VILSNLLNIGTQGIKGSLVGTYTEGIVTYKSSIDSITNLEYKYAYDNGLSNMPLLILMHGWTYDYDVEFPQAVMEKFASYKYFAVAVDMRGRQSAQGNKDASGRELMDISDAVYNVISRFPNLIDNKIKVIAGWSGGGGNVLGVCAKFPDLFNASIDNFGMSDYGYDGTDGWYYTNPAYSASISAILGDPAINKNEYLSRNTLNSITNYLGYLYIFQDVDDSGVNIVHSRNVDAELSGQLNYEYSETNSGDTDRWTHSAPSIGSDIEKAEPIWNTACLTRTRVTVPKSGVMFISGYLITKRFSIWLGDGVDTLKDGTNRSATVVYDVESGNYTVTPILESGVSDVEVKITQFDGKTATQTINSETIITVS